jgi:predicted chitinase
LTDPSANKAVNELEADGVLTKVTGKDRYQVFKAQEPLDLVERPDADLPAPNEIAYSEL